MNINKKICAVGVCLAILFCINKSSFASTGKVNTDVNMRESASTESDVVLSIPKDTSVEIIEENNGWYKVKFSDKTGYVRKDLLIVDNTGVSSSNSNQGDLNTQEMKLGDEPTNTQATSAQPVVEENNSQEQVKEETNNQAEENQGESKEDEKEENQNLGNKLNSETILYLLPAFNSSKIATIEANKEITIVKTLNNWSNIEVENQKGWIPNQKLLTTTEGVKEEETKPEEAEQPEETEKPEETKTDINQKGYVNTDSANLRNGPGTSNQSIAGLLKNEVLLVMKEVNGWYEVRLTDGTNGYVLKDLVTLGDPPVTSRSATDLRATQNAETVTAAAPAVDNSSVVNVAKQYLGCKYVSGGSSPSTGFDCSGFTSFVYAQCGKSITRTSYSQANDGVAVDRANLQPGDLLLFHYYGGSSIGHVGIYIGDGQFIHAANASRGVVTDTILSGYYADNYAGARRIN